MKEARHNDPVEEALGPLRDAQGKRVLRPARDLLPAVAQAVAHALEDRRRLTKGWDQRCGGSANRRALEQREPGGEGVREKGGEGRRGREGRKERE